MYRKVLVLHGNSKSTYQILDGPEIDDELIEAVNGVEGVAWANRSYGDYDLEISLTAGSLDTFRRTGDLLFALAESLGYRLREVITLG